MEAHVLLPMPKFRSARQHAFRVSHKGAVFQLSRCDSRPTVLLVQCTYGNKEGSPTLTILMAGSMPQATLMCASPIRTRINTSTFSSPNCASSSVLPMVPAREHFDDHSPCVAPFHQRPFSTLARECPPNTAFHGSTRPSWVSQSLKRVVIQRTLGRSTAQKRVNRRICCSHGTLVSELRKGSLLSRSWSRFFELFWPHQAAPMYSSVLRDFQLHTKVLRFARMIIRSVVMVLPGVLARRGLSTSR